MIQNIYIKKQLFKKMSSSKSFEKNPSPTLTDDRSTKKAKFKAQGADGDNSMPFSFHDKLMAAQRVVEGAAFCNEEDLIVEQEDVVFECTNNFHSISFSPKVHAQLMKPWQYTVVVKLLGHHIGYRALCNRLEIIWSSTQGFYIIDLDNDYYLILFKSKGDAEFVLTQGPWTIMGHYLTMQPWTPHFDSSKAVIVSVIAWIRLPGMALHYYYKKILRLMG